MFDQGQGIAVVAAYRLGPLDVAFQKRQTFTWDPTPGKFLFTCVWKRDSSLGICVSFPWIEVSSDTLYPQTMLARYQLTLPQIIPLPLESKNNPVWFLNYYLKISSNTTQQRFIRLRRFCRITIRVANGFMGDAKLRVAGSCC